MDFSYTPEEGHFRHEARSWLEANAPADSRGGGDADLSADERWERQKDWHKTPARRRLDWSLVAGGVRWTRGLSQ